MKKSIWGSFSNLIWKLPKGWMPTCNYLCANNLHRFLLFKKRTWLYDTTSPGKVCDSCLISEQTYVFAAPFKNMQTCILYQKSLLGAPGAPGSDSTPPQTPNIISLSSLFGQASSSAGVYVSGHKSPSVPFLAICDNSEPLIWGCGLKHINHSTWINFL